MLKPLLILSTIPVLLIAFIVLTLLVVVGKLLRKYDTNSTKQNYFNDSDDLYNCIDRAEIKEVS